MRSGCVSLIEGLLVLLILLRCAYGASVRACVLFLVFSGVICALRAPRDVNRRVFQKLVASGSREAMAYSQCVSSLQQISYEDTNVCVRPAARVRGVPALIRVDCSDILIFVRVLRAFRGDKQWQRSVPNRFVRVLHR